MIGDKIVIKPKHLIPAKKIVDAIIKQIQDGTKYSISIGGESGCGKSTLAVAIQTVLQKHGIQAHIFHMDDYFKLPPKTNHEARVKDINWVGPGEVQLNLLAQQIIDFKTGKQAILKPLVNYLENKILKETIDVSAIDVIITEGTYTTLLANNDIKIFMLRNYLDTFEDRKKRARDPIIPFNEKVLKIEHKIISAHAEMADILINKNYEILFKNISIQ